MLNEAKLHETNLNSPILYIRHAQSLYNLHSHGIDEEEIKSKKEFLDADLTDKGIKQSLNLANKLNDLNVRYVFCSPLMRCMQTCYNSLQSHPQKEKITVIIHPLIYETVHCCHDYSRNIIKKKAKFSSENHNGIKFDWSIFDKFYPDEKVQESFFLDYVDSLKDDDYAQSLIRRIRSLDADNVEEIEDSLVEFSKYFAGKKQRPESLHAMFKRNLKFREYLKTLDVDADKQEKVLVFTHSCFIKISTSRMAYNMDKIDDFPEDCYKPENCEVISIIN
jgi:broad specificity phosphatase PhoE